MAEFKPNDILHGSGGFAWFNGQKLATLQKAELKISGAFTDIEVCGDNSTYSVYDGYSGEGTFTRLKTDSTVLKLVAEAYETGIMPEITVTTALYQKGTNKVERVACSNVVITEYLLTQFEKKSMVEEEIPFKFGKFEVLEAI